MARLDQPWRDLLRGQTAHPAPGSRRSLLLLVEHEGRLWAHYGRFDRLERGSTIEHTWMSEPTRGVETVVTVTLAACDGGTRMTLRHADVPDDEEGRGHEAGWKWCLDMLAERFEKSGA